VITTVAKLDKRGAGADPDEPRNALVKQYQRLFELDGVELEFTTTPSRPSPTRPSNGAPARAACARSSKRCCST
jgi:ATP-dependent protease Clp ATPase subunit